MCCLNSLRTNLCGTLELVCVQEELQLYTCRRAHRSSFHGRRRPPTHFFGSVTDSKTADLISEGVALNQRRLNQVLSELDHGDLITHILSTSVTDNVVLTIVMTSRQEWLAGLEYSI